MKKFDMVEALRDRGFSVNWYGEGGAIILSRTLCKNVDVAFYGWHIATFTIKVSIYKASGICAVDYMKDASLYKTRWYKTAGKRTYNAISETACCAGYEF